MVKMDQDWQEHMDRRHGPDRRRRWVQSLKSLLIYRRRRYLRRKTDRRGRKLFDYYHPSLLPFIAAVLLFSVVDALLTLYSIGHGAVALNPMMAFFIERGDLFFIAAKYTATALSVFTVVLVNYFFIKHHNIYARHLLLFFAMGFSIVIVWELVLAFRFVL